MALTDAERVFVEALRAVRQSLMDTITGLDDTIAEIAQAAEARAVTIRPGVTVDLIPPDVSLPKAEAFARNPDPRCPSCGSTYRAVRRQVPSANTFALMTSIGCLDDWHPKVD